MISAGNFSALLPRNGSRAATDTAAANGAREELSETFEEELCGDCAKVTPIASADDPQGVKMVKAAAAQAGLDRGQRRILHDAITGQGITDFKEILGIAQQIKVGTW